MSASSGLDRGRLSRTSLKIFANRCIEPLEQFMQARELDSAIAGTIDAPIYYDGTADVIGDVRVNIKLYTYRTELGLVVGSLTSMMFSLDQPVKEVWPYFKDFNLWQPKHYYTGVVGDLEGRTFGIGDEPEQVATVPHVYQVVRVIPEHLIAVQQPVPRNANDTGLPGIGGVSAGSHTFTLHDHAGKTEIAIIMQHASYASRADEATAEQALAKWRAPGMMPEWHRKCRDEFIPELRLVVRERRRERRA
jgi:hypothetical protein